jgi:hypothetical protein
MPNDAKLGLLAGVAGVVAAAVLSLQNPPGSADPPDAQAAPATVQNSPPARTPVAPPRAPEPGEGPSSSGRPDAPAVPASRTRADGDD